MNHVRKVMSFLLLALSLFLFGSAALADEVKPDLKQEIFARLDAIGAKLGVLANHLWEVLVRQAYIEGVTDLIFAAIAAIWFLCAVKLLHTILNVPHEERKQGNTWWEYGDQLTVVGGIGTIAGTITGIGALVSGLYNLTTGIQQVMNPEFYALQYVLSELGH